MVETMTRAEHLAWCKARALEYVDAGDLAQAVASMTSDLSKHADTANDPAVKLAVRLIWPFLSDDLKGPKAASDVRAWIEGFA